MVFIKHNDIEYSWQIPNQPNGTNGYGQIFICRQQTNSDARRFGTQAISNISLEQIHKICTS